MFEFSIQGEEVADAQLTAVHLAKLNGTIEQAGRKTAEWETLVLHSLGSVAQVVFFG